LHKKKQANIYNKKNDGNEIIKYINKNVDKKESNNLENDG
jgi:hypothetical protein